MLLDGAVEVLLAKGLHLLRGDGSIYGGQGQDFVPRGLDGPGLVGGDMPRVRRDHALVMAQYGGDDGGVGLGAAYEKVHVCIRPTTGGPHLGPGTLAVVIQTVARRLLHIGTLERL